MVFSSRENRGHIQVLAETKKYASRASLNEKARINQIVKNFGEFSPSIPIWVILIALFWILSR